jgi:transcriptional regulator with XRE-family HTH domain
LLEKKVDEFGLRREVEEELAQILIEHKIANLRKRRGLTQAALARRSGVSQPMIAQIESGKLNNLTLKTLARTARALGASLKIDLISRSEPGWTQPTLRQKPPKYYFAPRARVVSRRRVCPGGTG